MAQTHMNSLEIWLDQRGGRNISDVILQGENEYFVKMYVPKNSYAKVFIPKNIVNRHVDILKKSVDNIEAIVSHEIDEMGTYPPIHTTNSNNKSSLEE